MSEALEEKLDRLRSLLGELDSALVAFSGGVDSTFLLRVAKDILNGQLIGAQALLRELRRDRA